MREVSGAAVPPRIARGVWLPATLLLPLQAALWLHRLLLLQMCCRQDYQCKLYYVSMLLSVLAGDCPHPMRRGTGAYMVYMRRTVLPMPMLG